MFCGMWRAYIVAFTQILGTSLELILATRSKSNVISLFDDGVLLDKFYSICSI